MSDDPSNSQYRNDADGRGHGEGSKNTWFKSGDGRPRPGRRKGSRDQRTIVEEILKMAVAYTGADGKRTKRSTLEAIYLKQRAKALQGDPKAIEFLMKRFDKYEPALNDRVSTSDLLAEDAIILESARRRGLAPEDDSEGGEA